VTVIWCLHILELSVHFLFIVHQSEYKHTEKIIDLVNILLFCYQRNWKYSHVSNTGIQSCSI